MRSLSNMRGPAPVAHLLYEETPQSLAQREQLAEQRRLAPEPADALAALHAGRPTKRDRREIDRVSKDHRSSGWGDRWSASIDD